MQHQYSRAERLLTRPFATSAPKHPSTPPLDLTNGDISPTEDKGKGRERDTLPICAPIPRLPMGPTGPHDEHDGVSRLVDMSVACRYLAAQCQVCPFWCLLIVHFLTLWQVRQGNWADATEMLGEANPFRVLEANGPAIPDIDGGIKVFPH